ncbi:uncharacterized protein BDZ99DRAFT_389189 [Mytilinidion resinicola]|uniref:HIT-type domain-containing protein n=1 Tax=Mytilinidion resinicola TaxID=574789 RepID=A0A6A6YJK0_9PEZI|nr:uncharacterized protein BDZ99DRAFT_389189 [Mytilinidion resinicola]KAF2808739.1 hypothetical protein BDZ99DRAFT_389189 [Mytilinidion resinicola]
MSVLCGVCSQAPQKYKCPTCQLPYCSIPCYKNHKASEHSSKDAPNAAPISKSKAPAPIPPTAPKVGDFSTLADHPSMQALLTSHPTLRDDLRKVYAATFARDPSQQQDHQEQRSGGTHRGHMDRGRGFGTRGRGRGRGGRGGADTAPWTPKKGENDALYMLKGIRQGKRDGNAEGMQEFVKLVGEIYGSANIPDDEAEQHGD